MRIKLCARLLSRNINVVISRDPIITGLYVIHIERLSNHAMKIDLIGSRV